MKKGITLNELAAKISRQKDAMADYLIAPSRLLMDTLTDTPKLRVLDENGKDRINPLEIGVYAHRQIAGYLNIPQAYYDLMLDKNPDLLGINVNDWLYRTEDRRLLRTLDGEARAFLSDRYKRIDNYDIAQATLPVILEIWK